MDIYEQLYRETLDRAIRAECRAIEAEGRERALLCRIAEIEGAMKVQARLAGDNAALRRGAIRAGREMAVLRGALAEHLVDEVA